MTKLPTFFSRDLHFAWLLRSDVRDAIGKHGNPAKKLFLGWWLTQGCKDYPAAPVLTSEQVAVVMESSELIEADADELPITHLMHYLWLVRGDLQDVCDIRQRDGRTRLIAWYYLHGVKEYGLPVTAAEIAVLARPSEKNLSTWFPFKLTNLGFLLWSFRDDVKRSFGDLASLDGHLRFLAWFYLQAIREFNLYPYLATHEVEGLFGPIKPTNRHDESIPAWLMLAWLANGALRSRFDLNDPDACKQINVWAENAGGDFYHIEALRSVPPVSLSVPVGTQSSAGSANRGRRRARPLKEQVDPYRFGVNLVGYAMGELGIGEDVRMMAKSLEMAAIPFCVINRKPDPAIRQADDSIVAHISTVPVYAITIICMTGFDTAQLWLERPDLFKGRYVIGYWPWELPAWPKEWHGVYEVVDEVWASSRYTENAYKTSCSKPVYHMPMSVTITPPTAPRRDDLGLPENRFLFLFVFDFMSYPDRKNPEDCIKAFRAAFPSGDENAGLVLKVSNVKENSPRWSKIKRLCGSDPRIILLQGTMDRQRVLGLMSVCDVYVSLHRAEGFGRTLAEAMLLRKPVIATGYSGNTDYLSERTGYVVGYELERVGNSRYPFGAGMSWAQPRWREAAGYMVKLFQNPESATDRVDAAALTIAENYGCRQVSQRYQKRLLEIADMIFSGSQQTMANGGDGLDDRQFSP